MNTRTNTKLGKSRLQLLHQYYSYTGFYTFVGNAVKKALPAFAIAVGAFYVINQFIDINAVFTRFTETLSVANVLLFFFASETILGLIPPEICIAWAGKTNSPWFYLSILAVLSYLGGMTSYYMGRLFTKTPSVHAYLERKMKKQLKNSKKWGGFLIVVGALLPLPFAMSCMAAGIIKYPFKNVVLLGALRLFRILFYGVIVFQMV